MKKKVEEIKPDMTQTNALSSYSVNAPVSQDTPDTMENYEEEFIKSQQQNNPNVQVNPNPYGNSNQYNNPNPNQYSQNPYLTSNPYLPPQSQQESSFLIDSQNMQQPSVAYPNQNINQNYPQTQQQYYPQMQQQQVPQQQIPQQQMQQQMPVQQYYPQMQQQVPQQQMQQQYYPQMPMQAKVEMREPEPPIILRIIKGEVTADGNFIYVLESSIPLKLGPLEINQ